MIKLANANFPKLFLWLPPQHDLLNKKWNFKYIFQKLLVVSDEVITVKDGWKWLQKFLKIWTKITCILSCFCSQLG